MSKSQSAVENVFNLFKEAERSNLEKVTTQSERLQ